MLPSSISTSQGFGPMRATKTSRPNGSKSNEVDADYMKDASNKFGHAPNGGVICAAPSSVFGRRRVAECPSVSCPNLIEEVRVNGVKIVHP